MAKRSVTDEQILYAVLAETGDAGELPGTRQVAKQLGMSPSAIHRRLAKLAERGIVKMEQGIRVLPEAVIFLTSPQTGSVTLRYVQSPTGLTLYSEPF